MLFSVNIFQIVTDSAHETKISYLCYFVEHFHFKIAQVVM